MLREIRNPRQWPNEAARRVFADPYFDLFVWTDGDGQITRFQLGYDKSGKPRAFEWLNGNLFHFRVDHGQDSHTQINMTPVLVADPRGRPSETAEMLQRSGIETDEWILAFVIARLVKASEPKG